MKTAMRCFWTILPLCALLGCQCVGPPGAVALQPATGDAYVSFIRDMMAESAQLKAESGEHVAPAESAVQAVGAWRGESQDQGG